VGARAVAADLADPKGPEQLLAQTGPVDVLVSNAALPGTGELVSFSSEQVDRALDVNLRAAVQLAHGVLPGMLARRSGSLVFVSSLAGLTATPNTSLYNATKFGLRGFALSLHQELRGTGVGATVVLPGFVRDAGMFADTGVAAPTGFGTCTPRDVAEAVLRAIDRNPPELLVGPAVSRLGARLGGLAPGLAARLQRLGVLGQVGSRMAQAQQDKR
jgi:short-subunit dehydrogenase